MLFNFKKLKQKNFKQAFKIVFTASIFIVFSSCGFIDEIKNLRKNNKEGKEFRIVDLDGNYKPINLHVPKLNKEALVKKNTITKGQSKETNVVLVKDNKKEAVVKYDMSNVTKEELLVKKKGHPKKSDKPKVLPKKNISKIREKKKLKKSKSIYIQIGSYSLLGNAKVALSKNKKILEKGKIEKVSRGDKKFYRVLLGPVSNKKEAGKLLKKVTNFGYKDAFIVRK